MDENQQTQEPQGPDFSFEALKRNFPFASMRPGQEETLRQVAAALNKPEVRFVVIQAPTGAGKSPLAIAIARSANQKGAYVLTSNKMLQDQYLRDFEDKLKDFRGRANYRCHRFPTEGQRGEKGQYSCADSPCRSTREERQACARESICGFHIAKHDAINSPITSMNFAAGMCHFKYTEGFTERDVLIIDEAHLVESQLTNFVEFNMPKSAIEREFDGIAIPDTEEPLDYLEFFKEIYDITKTRLDSDAAQVENYEETQNLCYKALYLWNELKRDPNNITVQIERFDRKEPRYIFKPINVAPYAERELFWTGDKVVLMSATIINYREFCRALGIAADKAVFIDVPSTFPKENRPIKKAYVGRINKNNIDALMPKIAEFTTRILEFHKDQKGIIHTSSYKMAEELKSLIRKPHIDRILFPKNSKEAKEMLEYHTMAGRPTVLISPAMAEGVDLKDDLSRFQIITKMPYPSMGDKVVQARMKRNAGWYAYTTALRLIQSYGRSVRSDTDKAATYVLDEALESVLQQNGNALPKWFTEAISW